MPANASRAADILYPKSFSKRKPKLDRCDDQAYPIKKVRKNGRVDFLGSARTSIGADSSPIERNQLRQKSTRPPLGS
jgi:hypothetical protein